MQLKHTTTNIVPAFGSGMATEYFPAAGMPSCRCQGKKVGAVSVEVAVGVALRVSGAHGHPEA